MEIKKSTRILW
uniref:Uncharacterized protein n=1 Tax=Anguilla anguilla TaxID=7936 RepID=A0A0E9RYG3_ANGAN